MCYLNVFKVLFNATLLYYLLVLNQDDYLSYGYEQPFTHSIQGGKKSPVWETAQHRG